MRGVAAVMAVVLAVMVIYRPDPVVIERDRFIAAVPGESTDASSITSVSPDGSPEPPLPAESMLAMRQVALERGVDQLPSLPGGHLHVTHQRDLAMP
jgi:hypothetical protein